MAELKVPKLMSKTKLMRGYQCLKQIFLTVHKPELEAPVSPELQARFDDGHLVGAKAREQFPGGVLIDNKPWDFIGSLRRTRELLRAQTPLIYEAAFEFNGCYARADIIKYVPESGRWQIYEVKSSTRVKDEQLQDVALQAWIMAKGGLPIAEIYVVHLNPACKFPDLSNLFSIVDVTEQCRQLYMEIGKEVGDIWKAVKSMSQPMISVGQQCTKPYECGFKKHCFTEAQIPEFSILDLPNLKAEKWELLSKGICDITDPEVPKHLKLSDLQKRVIEIEKSGERFVDRKAISTELQTWKFPLTFLDFETVQSTIPRFKGCGPYAQVPFQFSVHKLSAVDAKPEHFEFLHDQDTDPRPTLIPVLLKACEGSGSVVAYYKKFEGERLLEMAEAFPEHHDALKSIADRLVDPLPLLRDSVYDKNFKGKFGLKAVAPALLGEAASYEKMQVADGTAAQRAFAAMVLAEGERKTELRKALLQYCEKDTAVVVDLVKWLFKHS